MENKLNHGRYAFKDDITTRYTMSEDVLKRKNEDDHFKNFLSTSVGRFLNHDWGNVSDEEKEQNYKAVTDKKGKIHAVYKRPSSDEKIQIDIDADGVEGLISFCD